MSKAPNSSKKEYQKQKLYIKKEKRKEKKKRKKKKEKRTKKKKKEKKGKEKKYDDGKLIKKRDLDCLQYQLMILVKSLKPTINFLAFISFSS